MSTLAVAVLVGELLAIVLLFSGGNVTWVRFALNSLFVQWVVLCSSGVLCWTRRYLEQFGLANGALVAFLLVITVTFIVGVTADRVMAEPGQAVNWPTVGSQLLISGIITGMVLRYFFVQQKLRDQEQAELESRIQALQSRIRPHFLFNSMNIIASLIATDPDTAELVVEDLSELFRASLNDAGNQVDLTDELALCERYVRIEGLRLGDRLSVDWDVDTDLGGVKIPLLTLQPLLENSIYHGIQPLPEGGTIRVQVGIVDDEVQVVISNPLPGAGSGQSEGNRMAVSNIKSRLGVMYGNTAALTAEEIDGQYVTRLNYPAHAERI